MSRTHPVWTAALCALIAACGVGTIDGPASTSDASVTEPPDTSTPDARRGAPDADDDNDEPDARPSDPPRFDARPTDPPPPDARPTDPPPPDARPTDPPPDARPPTPDAGPVTGLDCRNAASWPAAWTALEDEIVVLVNQNRAAGATCGTTVHPARGPVTSNPQLREASRCHSLDRAVNDYFSHDSQDGRDPWERMREAGYTGSPAAENISAGHGTARATVDGWMRSVGHCNNIMGAGSNEIGVGWAEHDGSRYGDYATQGFGSR